ncbi:MAG: DNA replication and repair protein RecF [Coriobacteriales bacterium]|jgi:DNA replication and repair protein RecF|nr:DNA replication and repair protein RecF [Coriobacteriales bacterium]
MYSIQRIVFDNFRNYPSLVLDGLGQLVVIVGDNAIGKTNIIEGIQLVSMIESFRRPSWPDVICHGANRAQVTLDYCFEGVVNSLSLVITDNSRSYRLNDKDRRPKDLLGHLPAVLFTPNDLTVVKGPAERRRELVDRLGCQISRSFFDIKHEYQQVVKQKNALLRDDNTNSEVLASWNNNLVRLGAALTAHRSSLFDRLLEAARDVYATIAPHETLEARYVPSWELLDPGGLMGLDKSEAGVAKQDSDLRLRRRETVEEDLDAALRRHQAREEASRRSLIGPHRDELAFSLNNRDVRRFSSQGQQRSITLALKAAEVRVLRAVTRREPLLLLDDVMSELDEARRRLFIEHLDAATQVFVTTTDLGYFDESLVSRAQVVHLPIASGGQLKAGA